MEYTWNNLKKHQNITTCKWWIWGQTRILTNHAQKSPETLMRKADIFEFINHLVLMWFSYPMRSGLIEKNNHLRPIYLVLLDPLNSMIFYKDNVISQDSDSSKYPHVQCEQCIQVTHVHVSMLNFECKVHYSSMPKHATQSFIK
jgi:hypothetical protein